MFGEKLFFFLLFLHLGYTQSCPKYSCSNSNTYCLEYTFDQGIVSPCSTAPNTYCALTIGYNQSCTVPPSSPQRLLPGLSCSLNSNCLSGECYKGYCSGKSKSETCQLHEGYSINADCNPGLYCSIAKTQSICLPLKEQYEPCTNDYECLYGRGCYSGVCLEYGKIDNGDEIYMSYCISGTSPFCEDEQCFIFADGTARCIEVLETEGKANAFCTDNYGCQSKFNKRVQGVVLGQCQCGLNSEGTAYCSNFLGDGYTKKYFEFLKEWGQGDNIEKCNIDVAFTPSCIQSRGGKSRHDEFVYYQFMSKYQAIIKGGLKCALSVLIPTFNIKLEDLLTEQVSISFGLALSVTFLGLI